MKPVSDTWVQSRNATVRPQAIAEVVVDKYSNDPLVFTNNKLISVEVNESYDYLGVTIPIPTLRFTIENYDGTYSPENPQGDMGKLKLGTTVYPYLGYRFDDTTELIQGGMYYITDITADDDTGVVDVECVSYINRFDNIYYDNPDPDRSAYDLILSILLSASFPATYTMNYWVYDEDDERLMYPYDENDPEMLPLVSVTSTMWEIDDAFQDDPVTGDLSPMTVRDALSRVLAMTNGQVRIDSAGALIFSKSPIAGYWNYVVYDEGDSRMMFPYDESNPAMKPLYHLDVEHPQSVYEDYRLTASDMFGFPKFENTAQYRGVISKVYGVSTPETPVTTETIFENVRVTRPEEVEPIVEIPILGAPPLDPAPDTQTFLITHEGVWAEHSTLTIDPLVSSAALVGTPEYGTYQTTFEVECEVGDTFTVSMVGVKREKKALEISLPFANGSGEEIQFDNELIDDMSLANVVMTNVGQKLLRPTYTISTRDDPALEVGDVIVVDTRYQLGKILTLVEAKRTFDGSFKAEYTFR